MRDSTGGLLVGLAVLPTSLVCGCVEHLTTAGPPEEGPALEMPAFASPLVLQAPVLTLSVDTDSVSLRTRARQVSWRLEGLEQAGVVRHFGPPTVETEGRVTRLVYGGVTEEWDRGDVLEQRFVVSRGTAPSFSLVGRVGGATPAVSEDGDLRLHAGGAPVIDATAPRAWDGTGRELDARFVVDGPIVRVEVRGVARYPVLIDPAWSARGEDVAGARFGTAVASAGDVNGDGYDDVIVGADGNGMLSTRTGEAYIYFGSAGVPSVTADWVARGDVRLGALFGTAVASAGDVNGDGYDDVVVGARSQDNPSNSEGRAFVYYGSPTGPATTADWASSGDQADQAAFGTSVASAGDVDGDGYDDVIVGAIRPNPGKAFLYRGSATGLSTTPDWTAAEGTAGQYGQSVASAGDVNGDGYDDIVVGAYIDDTVASNAGRAFVYYGSPSGPSVTADWVSSGDGTANARFGVAVAGVGDVNRDGYDDVIVSAYAHTSNTGLVYLYEGSAAGLSPTPAWTSDGDAIAESYFGISASGAGDVDRDGYADVLIGAYRQSSEAGKAFVYGGSASGLAATPMWTFVGESAGDWFGVSARSAGDVNGDVFADIIVGAYRRDSDTGEAYLFLGTPDGPADVSVDAGPFDGGFDSGRPPVTDAEPPFFDALPGDELRIPPDAGEDAGVVRPRSRGGCGCEAVGQPSSSRGAAWWLFLVAATTLVWRRTRNTDGPSAGR
jgi:hypothetical protein